MGRRPSSGAASTEPDVGPGPTRVTRGTLPTDPVFLSPVVFWLGRGTGGWRGRDRATRYRLLPTLPSLHSTCPTPPGPPPGRRRNRLTCVYGPLAGVSGRPLFCTLTTRSGADGSRCRRKGRRKLRPARSPPRPRGTVGEGYTPRADSCVHKCVTRRKPPDRYVLIFLGEYTRSSRHKCTGVREQVLVRVRTLRDQHVSTRRRPPVQTCARVVTRGYMDIHRHVYTLGCVYGTIPVCARVHTRMCVCPNSYFKWIPPTGRSLLLVPDPSDLLTSTVESPVVSPLRQGDLPPLGPVTYTHPSPDVTGWVLGDWRVKINIYEGSRRSSGTLRDVRTPPPSSLPTWVRGGPIRSVECTGRTPYHPVESLVGPLVTGADREGWSGHRRNTSILRALGVGW